MGAGSNWPRKAQYSKALRETFFVYLDAPCIDSISLLEKRRDASP
jgi:hypothetical protein